jgi:short-subunit dehydrogenase
MSTYLLIGAGPGIGLATARLFAEQGYRVVLAARNIERLQQFVAQLQSEGHMAAAERVDASSPTDVAALVQRIGSDLSVVHYNAGILHYNSLGELQARPLESESVDSIISDTQINLVSAMAAARAAVPLFAGRTGVSILFTGGGFGIQPTGDFLTLSVGKAGIRATTLALFEPLRQKSIHVGTVTVSRLVSPDSTEAMDVANAFWELHTQSPEAWVPEIVYG